MALVPRRYSSWSVLNDKVVVKHCDYSAHKHRLTEINKPIWEFWDIQNFQRGQKDTVWLTFNGIREEVRIEVEGLGQGRLYFTKTMVAYLKKYEFGVYNVTLTFEKVGFKEYCVKATKEKVNLKAELDEPLQSEVLERIKEKKEGTKKAYYTTVYERLSQYREAAIRIHGCVCAACKFDFRAKYGEIGRDYIEVHHVKPLYSLEKPIPINPKKDLVCVCANCHRMIHRKRDEVLTIEELKKRIEETEKKGKKV